MLSNCGAGEDSWESLRQQGDAASRCFTIWATREVTTLKEINPKYSLESLMVKLKLQYFGYLMQKTDLLEKILMLGKIEAWRRKRWQRMRWLEASPTRWTWVWVGSRGLVMDKKAQHTAVHGVAKTGTWLSNWTELKYLTNVPQMFSKCYQVN